MAEEEQVIEENELTTQMPPTTTRNRLVKKQSKASVAAEPCSEDQPWVTAHLNKNKQGDNAPESAVAASDNHTTTAATNASPVATTAAEDADAITPLPRRDVYIDPLSGHSNVTLPARAPRRHAYSECFDLDDMEPGGHIRSPSGNVLSAEQAASRADRPMGIKERQEAIRKKVAEQNKQRMGNETTIVGDARGKKSKRERVKAWFECHCQ